MEDREPIRKWDMFAVLLLTIFTGIVSELLTFFLVYKRTEYRKLNAEISKLQRKSQHHNQRSGMIHKRDKANFIDKEYQRKSRQLSAMRSKANMLTGVIFMIVTPFMYNMFEGVVMAKLPFQPIVPFRYLTHSSLNKNQSEGTEVDYTDCSFIFIYTFALMLTKQNTQKLLGYGSVASGTRFQLSGDYFGAGCGGTSSWPTVIG